MWLGVDGGRPLMRNGGREMNPTNSSAGVSWEDSSQSGLETISCYKRLRA